MTLDEKTLNQIKKQAAQSPNFKGNTDQAMNNHSIQDLADSIKETLKELQSYIESMDIQAFYTKIEGLKYLIEYSDELNKNWYLIRAYSGALRRLLKEKSIENTIDVYHYYEQTYGGRRVLREENWFEQNRWEFIDELKAINSADKLEKFIKKRVKKLDGFFQSYKSELMLFIQDLQKLS